MEGLGGGGGEKLRFALRTQADCGTTYKHTTCAQRDALRVALRVRGEGIPWGVRWGIPWGGPLGGPLGDPLGGISWGVPWGVPLGRTPGVVLLGGSPRGEARGIPQGGGRRPADL